MKPRYLFGDGDIAARRLEVLARVFEHSTRAFISEAADSHAGVALDLGCGPGFTTHLIVESLRCDRVIGLDASPHFIELAQRSATATVSFALHDVCAVPFPFSPADLIFCRYLLTHLQDPGAVVQRWATQIASGGMLLIEEVEAIHTAHPVFVRYLSIVAAMLAQQHNCLYAGGIAAAVDPRGLVAGRNSVRTVAVKNSDAAQMFVLNMQAWRQGEFVRANYPARAVSDLEDELQRLADDQSPARDIEWAMRQVAFRRRP